MRSKLLGLGGLQVGLATLAFTGVSLIIGQVWSVSLTIGWIFALSSTAIVLQTLKRTSEK
jgi:Kef-type K+ transport system membrane component KefB